MTQGNFPQENDSIFAYRSLKDTLGSETYNRLMKQLKNDATPELLKTVKTYQDLKLSLGSEVTIQAKRRANKALKLSKGLFVRNIIMRSNSNLSSLHYPLLNRAAESLLETFIRFHKQDLS